MLIATAVIGNQFYADANVVARVVGYVLILIAAAGGVIYCNRQGKQARLLLVKRTIEVRKVVWPTRQEALNTTFVSLQLPWH